MVSNSRTVDALGFLQLRCVLEVGRLGGFTAAAEALGLSKSAVSKHVARVEEQLGVRLFERSSRQVAATRAGARLLPRIDSILADGEGLLADALLERSEPTGLVRIAATPEFGAVVARVLLPALAERRPGIELAMTSTYTTEDLQSPAFDLAFRVGGVGDEALVARTLGRFHRVLVASPSFVVAHPVTEPHQLTDVPSVVFCDREPHSRRALVRDDGERVSVPIHGPIAVRSFRILTELAADGHGVASVPDFVVADALEAGRVVRVLPRWSSPPSPVLLVHRVGAQRVRRVAAVAELARELLSPLLSA